MLSSKDDKESGSESNSPLIEDFEHQEGDRHVVEEEGDLSKSVSKRRKLMRVFSDNDFDRDEFEGEDDDYEVDMRMDLN